MKNESSSTERSSKVNHVTMGIKKGGDDDDIPNDFSIAANSIQKKKSFFERKISGIGSPFAS